MLVYLLSAIETDEDRALFVDLFEKYHDRMEQAALRIVKNSHDAEDAVQNAYLQIIRHLDKVSEIPDSYTESLKLYKMRICRLSVILIKFQRFRVRIGDSGASL